jgi:transposase
MTPTIDTLVPELLWQAIQPLLPTPPRRYGGRPRVDDRACLAGIVYQLRTGVPWRLLPTRQLGCGSPATYWRRLRDWQRAGVWRRLHTGCWTSSAARAGSTGPGRAWTRSACAPSGGLPDRPEPDRPRQARSKYHLLVDRGGIPLAACLSAANTHDSMPLEQVMDAVWSVRGSRGRAGRPRKRPAKLHLDKGYDYPRCRRALRRRGITPRIARRGVESRQRLGRHRYMVERSLAWRWATGGCRSATSGAPISCLGSCTWPVR